MMAQQRGLCPCDPRIFRFPASPIPTGRERPAPARVWPRNRRSSRIPAELYPPSGPVQFTAICRRSLQKSLARTPVSGLKRSLS